MSEDRDLFDFLYSVPDSSHASPESEDSMGPNGEEDKEEAVEE